MIKKLKITVDSKTYEVTVDMPDEPAPPVKEPIPASPIASPDPGPVLTAAPKSSGPGDVVSPLAGRVVSIGVQVGQQVKEGDHVLTLEAMKMNTFVFAPKNGKIKSIKVEAGAGVQEGDVLLVLE